MATEYEHEGVTYHEPLPRICLVEFGEDVVDGLKGKGYNAKVLPTLHAAGGDYKALIGPWSPHEVDILIVRDNAEVVRIEHPGGGSTFSSKAGVHTAFSSGILSPSAEHRTITAYCRAILGHGGICIVYLAEHNASFLAHMELGIAANSTYKLWPGRTAHRQFQPPDAESLAFFIKKWFKVPNVYIGLTVHVSHDPTVLLTDTASVPYVLLYRIPTHPSQAIPGLVLCLPDYDRNVQILDSLLSDVLPDLAPHLFPFRRDLSWLSEPQFAHAKVTELRASKESIREETENKLNDLDQQIGAWEQSEQYLTDLLTADGDSLKVAVKRALEDLFLIAGLAGVPVLDVDSDPALREGNAQKREDLRVEWTDAVYLFNVAGREQYCTPTSLNQLSKHHRLFSRSNPMRTDDIHNLLVANFNYGGGSDPRKRGEMFGSGTVDAQARLLAEGYGAIGTFDLYRLVRALQRSEVHLQPDDLRRLFSTTGILNFEEFVGSLKTSSAEETKAVN